MSNHEQFVRDYLLLGSKEWLKRYAHNRPVGATPRLFAQEVLKLGLQDNFIDVRDWGDGRLPKKHLYLVAEPPGRYSVYTVERAIPFLEGTYVSLIDALTHKADFFFMSLDFEAMPKKPLQRD
jgi:hypothetical protein